MFTGPKSSISLSAGLMSRCAGHPGRCVSGDLVRTGLACLPLPSACCRLTAVWATCCTQLRCKGQTYCTRPIVARCHLRRSISSTPLQGRHIGTPENAVQRLALMGVFQAVSRGPTACALETMIAGSRSNIKPRASHAYSIISAAVASHSNARRALCALIET